MASDLESLSSASDLWVITCYFNSNGYRTKRKNYEQFIAGLKSVQVPYKVVECAIGDNQFELPDETTTIRVRGADVLWQKERLLNVALASLPMSCTKVAWVDCDLLFEDPLWIKRASVALDTIPVIQPFTTVVRLPKGQIAYTEEGETYMSFGAVFTHSPQLVRSGEFAQHGHTGFAWAARRDWLDRHGFYDACITGSGDHLMAHAMCGDLESPCMDNMLGKSGPYREHFARWAVGVNQDVRGQIGSIPGRVLHLWHGSLAERRYHLRNQQLQTFAFDPSLDLRIDAGGAWKWASPKTALHHWARAFFTLRNEDGEFTFVNASSAYSNRQNNKKKD